MWKYLFYYFSWTLIIVGQCGTFLRMWSIPKKLYGDQLLLLFLAIVIAGTILVAVIEFRYDISWNIKTYFEEKSWQKRCKKNNDALGIETLKKELFDGEKIDVTLTTEGGLKDDWNDGNYREVKV